MSALLEIKPTIQTILLYLVVHCSIIIFLDIKLLVEKKLSLIVTRMNIKSVALVHGLVPAQWQGLHQHFKLNLTG